MEIAIVIDVVDIVVVIVIAPVIRPRFRVFEPISAVLEALPFPTPDATALGTGALLERMFTSEAATETVLRNAAVLAAR
ncbi:MAG: hypothetical protein JWO71_1359 [Candidatus Acidoferrum typicum]|nr:hypothetical protein [Candidatus Acidoferrum typicum]